ncbi:MAG: hypothetical protein F6K26_46540 [Moorea sp. SIO2I5]|nr:hypothetical protein [Moorena sp. SIO2I5]
MGASGTILIALAISSFSLFPIPDSRFPIPDSRFPIQRLAGKLPPTK